MTTATMTRRPHVVPDVCQTCEVSSARPRHLAKRGYDRWYVCDRCRWQGERLGADVVYVEVRSGTSEVRTPDAPAAPSLLTPGDVPVRDLLDTPTPYVGLAHPATAQVMQDRALPRSGTLRRQVAEAIAQRGMTDDDIETTLGRSHQSASSARNGLVRDGLVRDSGATRVNSHGNDAIVWVATRALLDLLGDDR